MIQEGLLWFDDNPTRSVGDKIERAVQRYQQKYGHDPDVCYVHESEIRAQLKEGDHAPGTSTPLGNPRGMGCSLAQDVKVLPAKSVLPHHFWLGVTETADKRNKRKRAARAT